MHLYHLTLQPPTAVYKSIYGSFSAPKTHEILVSRGRLLELFQIKSNGKVESITSVNVFGIIRSLVPVRLPGSSQDYVVVGSDSGKVSILEFDQQKKKFKRVHEETFGRSGCRRIVPGQFMAADPLGRAVMVAAVEKQKFVYILNRDNTAKLTISSPLEAHKSYNLCFDVVGVDVGFDNPIFACIEVDYADAEDSATDTNPKSLTYYELDLGLNHVVRKWSDPIDPTSNLLVSIPGGTEGPGGVLICAENFLYWKHQGKEDVAAAYPRRKDMNPEKGLLIVSHTIFRRRNFFFVLLQSELGDLYKVTLNLSDSTTVDSIAIKYFDSIAVASSLSMMRTGTLFVGAESGNHAFYQIEEPKTKQDDEEDGAEDSADSDNDEEVTDSDFVLFNPRSLKKLNFLTEIDSVAPIIDFQSKDFLRQGSPQFGLAGGTENSSSFRLLEYGLSAIEATVTPVPGVPTGIWTVRKTDDDPSDSYIVISFADRTMILTIGDRVSEIRLEDIERETGLEGRKQTLNIRQIGKNSIVQVLQTGLRLVGPNGKIEWTTPGRKTIVKSTINQRQIMIALNGGMVYYFQVNISDQLEQLIEMGSKNFEHEISSIELEPIPDDRVFARFAAVGEVENKVRLMILDPNEGMTSVAVQLTQSSPSSLAIQKMRDEAGDSQHFLFIGSMDGILTRVRINHLTGELSDIRRKLIGVTPVKLFKINANGGPAVLALSSKNWITYNHNQRLCIQPLCYVPLDHASNFCSEQCPEGLISIDGQNLRISVIENFGRFFNSKEFPLRNTPRKFVHIPKSSLIVTIETDNNLEGVVKNPEQWHREQRFVNTKVGSGKWASSVRLFDTLTGETLDYIELEEKEAAFSITLCNFTDREEEIFIAVGTAKNLTFKPRGHAGGSIKVYSIKKPSPESFRLNLICTTSVEDIPAALAKYSNKLLAGVGNNLRLYELGKKNVLKKCERQGFPSMIKTIICNGDRIIVGDVKDSFFFVRYKSFEKKFYCFADDNSPRWITAGCAIDYDTVAGGDKFGNIFFLRLPKEVSTEIEADPLVSQKMNSHPNAGCPLKLQNIVNFYVGEAVTSVQKTSLVPGADDVVVYTTISGAIGIFLPFVSRDDIDLFQKLEIAMRKHNPPLCGRDHIAFRSYYFPVKDVVDGDLCEQFLTLSREQRQAVADDIEKRDGMNQTIVLKKLEDVRNRHF